MRRLFYELLALVYAALRAGRRAYAREMAGAARVVRAAMWREA